MISWSILLPPWQGPDEIAHFAYTQRIVETKTIPWFRHGDPGENKPSYSTELGVAAAWGGVTSLLTNVEGRPPGSPLSERLWREHDAPLTRADRQNGGFTSTMVNPPLYYLYASIPYAATSSLSIFDRAWALRLFNLPLLLAIVWLTWLIAGELLPRPRWLQPLATAAVALNPQLVEIASADSPDILLAAVWTAFFYLAIMALRHGPTRGRLLGMAALCVASALTHGRGLAIFAPALFVALCLLWRYRRPSRKVVYGGAAILAVGAIVGAYLALSYTTSGHITTQSLRQFGSYMWQFYLPRLGFQNQAIGPVKWGVQQVFIERFYGTYGALDVVFPPGAMSWAKWLSIIGIVLAFVGLAMRWGSVRRWPDVTALFGVAAGFALLQMHLAGFKSLFGGSGDPVITGRYLLPFIVVYGLAIALAVSWLPRRVAPVAAGVVVGLLCLLTIGALGLSLGRYYA
jgi:hypothetical protein